MTACSDPQAPARRRNPTSRTLGELRNVAWLYLLPCTACVAGAVRVGDPTEVAAAAALVAAPILVVSSALQRRFIRALLAGAIKE